MYQPTHHQESPHNVILTYRLEPEQNLEAFLSADDEALGYKSLGADLIDEHTDGQFTEDVAEMVYGTIGSDSSDYLSGEEETDEQGYLDPKLLLPDLYSASLFEEEEEQQTYLSPVLLMYRPETVDYDGTTYFPLEFKSEAEEPETLGAEEPEPASSTKEQQEGLDLEERLAA